MLARSICKPVGVEGRWRRRVDGFPSRCRREQGFQANCHDFKNDGDQTPALHCCLITIIHLGVY